MNIFRLISCFLILLEYRKVIIVGDSIIKFLPPIEGVQIAAFPGATIGKLSYLFSSRKVAISEAEYIMLHIGTNNVANGQSAETILADYANLIAIVRRLYPSIKIICSAILPRPVDHQTTDSVIRLINKSIETDLTKNLNIKFIRSYRPFCENGKVKRYLFAKMDGGLHLNSAGADQLRHFFIRVISTL